MKFRATISAEGEVDDEAEIIDECKAMEAEGAEYNPHIKIVEVETDRVVYETAAA